jgi:hypothetical protein
MWNHWPPLGFIALEGALFLGEHAVPAEAPACLSSHTVPPERALKTDQREEINMSKVRVNTEAPDFVLNDFNGNPVSLSDYKHVKHVLLVLNRSFL